MFFSAGMISFTLSRLGITILPENPSSLDYVRGSAFVIACVNVGTWMWFPLEDLRVLRKWVHTKRKLFPRHTSETWAIILATILLLASVLGALSGAVWFGVAGAVAYLWNFIGFAYVRKHVAIAAKESRLVFEEQKEPTRTLFLQALDVVEQHWTCNYPRLFGGWQQRRHFSLFVAFTIAAILGWSGTIVESSFLKILSYSIGILTVIAAEVSIAIYRDRRDKRLAALEQEIGDPTASSI